MASPIPVETPPFKGKRGNHPARGSGGKHVWSDDEKEYMRRWIPEYGYSPIARALGLDEYFPVRHFAEAEGIEPPEPPPSFRIIAEALGMSRNEVVRCYKSGMRKLSELLKECYKEQLISDRMDEIDRGKKL